ncbi:ABC transporter ATP-binding protein [Hyphomonas sp.]|uniref:ABC transporter transmembrane domain-containing protein n=1 Tax=Hyphomonas sp. TaxID=87 RepID=UPI0025B9C8DC|nr:ABC transporter ATP-binding protein [Hyphomonas sp.]
MTQAAHPPGLRAAILFGAGQLGASLDPAGRVMLTAAGICALAGAALAAGAPVALKHLVEALDPAAPAVPASLSPVFWLCAYVGALGAGKLAGEVRGYCFGAAEQSISRKLARRAFEHVLSLPMTALHRHSTGGLVQTLENGLLGYRLVLQHALFTLLPGLAETALIAVLLFHFFDSVLLAVFGACAALYMAVFQDGARRILRAGRAVSSARIGANALLSDGLMNIETVKAFCSEAALAERLDVRLADVQQRWRDFYKARFATGVLVTLVFTAGLGAALWLSASRVEAGSMSLGDLVLVSAWMLQVIRPLELAGSGIRDIGQGAAFAGRLNGLLREAAEPAAGASPAFPGLSGGPPSIRFEHVSFTYPGGRKVLDDVSFEIEAGKVTAIAGPSGSGKSSILRLLMRFHEPDEGRILIGGILVRDYPASEIRKLIAFTPQDAGLLDDSLAFNISMPHRVADPRRLEDAARQAMLEEVINRLPDGFETLTGERGARLSGGEKQRAAIARALYRQAPIRLADEATSALDYPAEERLAANGVFAGGRVTSVIVAHRAETIALADNVIVLSDGRVVDQGR